MTAKSDRAKEILNDPVIQEAFQALRDKYRSVLGSNSVPDVDILDVHRMLLLLNRLEQHIKQIIASGELDDLRANEEGQPSFLGNLIKWPTN